MRVERDLLGGVQPVPRPLLGYEPVYFLLEGNGESAEGYGFARLSDLESAGPEDAVLVEVSEWLEKPLSEEGEVALMDFFEERPDGVVIARCFPGEVERLLP